MSTTDDNNGQRGGDSGGITSSKEECTLCEQTNVDNITEGIISVAILDDTCTCANCGKEGKSDDMNTCNKCEMVKYCNAACKKKHRKKHKKACERRVAELHDEALFKEIEPEDCPICMLPMPFETNTSVFKSCCGKRICLGCTFTMKMTSKGKDLCAFCRTPPFFSDGETINRIKKLMKKGNAEAFNMLAGCYDDGVRGLPQDLQKANELYLKAGELGSAIAYYNLGDSYNRGTGVEMDKKKAKHYYELSAIKRNIVARHNLGVLEWQAGNYDRAFKHFILAAKAGYEESLDVVKQGFTKGRISKDEYTNTLRAYDERHEEMKSKKRDIAEACYRRLG